MSEIEHAATEQALFEAAFAHTKRFDGCEGPMSKELRALNKATEEYRALRAGMKQIASVAA